MTEDLTAAQQLAVDLSVDELSDLEMPVIVRVVEAVFMKLKLIDEHILEVDAAGIWVLQHPVQERPNLLGCVLGIEVAEFMKSGSDPGTYLAWLEKVDSDTELFLRAV